MPSSDNAPLHLWGKASGAGEQPVVTHPALYHCLDVAAVAARLIDADPALQQKLAGRFNAPFGSIRTPLLALVALHDVGKAATGFQAIAGEAFWPAELGDYPGKAAYDHAEGGFQMLTKPLLPIVASLFGDMEAEARIALCSATTYHHGQPLDRRGGSTKLVWGDAQIAAPFAQALLDVVNPDGESFPAIDERDANRVSWLISGLINLSDWAGSDTNFFPYCAPDLTPDAYWRDVAQPNARCAVEALRLAPQPIAPAPTWDRLFPRWEPSPLQRACAEMELPEQPCLIIVEDVTGAGKTEAALVCIARLMERHRYRGAFIGLPTMATSSAMYRRMSHQYRALYEPQADPSLVLSHGRAGLDADFRASIWPGNGPASCAKFFADNRKCGSLADFAVGTIDQALMSVLPTRHATLRQYGLSRQVLVLDEVHAYDAFMGREIERLVSFHAAHGGSVVLLSATLPQRVKERLASAYSGEDVVLAAGEYPLVTVVSRSPA